MGLSNIILAVNRLPVYSRLLRVRLPQGKLVAPTLDRLLYLLLLKLGIMGRAETRYLREHVKGGMCVVDVGANIGAYTLILSRLVGPSGKVTSFEPDPLLFSALRRNMHLNSSENVNARQAAVGAERGSMRLRRSPFNSGDNRVRQGQATGPLDCDVEVCSLDEELKEIAIDLVKVDVQGHELHVLKGMAQMMARGMPRTIYLEFWPGGCREAGYDPMELIDLLQSHGYEVGPVGFPPISARSDWSRMIETMGRTKFTDLVATFLRTRQPVDGRQ